MFELPERHLAGMLLYCPMVFLTLWSSTKAMGTALEVLGARLRSLYVFQNSVVSTRRAA